jgi:4-hydroxy-3-polyprenylbenzoate decarboxylase
MTGASGSILALDLLHKLRLQPEWETHFVMSRGARLTMDHEVPGMLQEFLDHADVLYDNSDIDAAISSGTFSAAGMVIVPCSMKTMAGIHSGYSENLILRAADVTLKECRPLILVPRETPLSTIHLRNMYELSAMGVTMIPPMLTFYNSPTGIDDMVTHITGKILDHFGIESEGFCRWKG